MREEFKPKREELLRKAWKKEWVDMDKAIGEDGELVPSWETFNKVRKNKRKNVHAYVAGEMRPKQMVAKQSYEELDQVKYNPYKNDFFVDAQTGEEMRDVYEKAYVINKKIFVKKA